MRRRPVDSGGDDAPLFSLDGSGDGGRGSGIYPKVSAPPSSYSRQQAPQRKVDHHGSLQAINVREGRGCHGLFLVVEGLRSGDRAAVATHHQILYGVGVRTQHAMDTTRGGFSPLQNLGRACHGPPSDGGSVQQCRARYRSAAPCGQGKLRWSLGSRTYGPNDNLI